MDESTVPLLDNNEIERRKSERKKRGKITQTIKTIKSFPSNINSNINNLKLKDSKAKKIENKFIFKVYLHFLIHICFIILINILTLKIGQFYYIIATSIILFSVFSILTFTSLILPLFFDKILRLKPFNYLYLIIFTISLSYIISKILVSFEFTFTYAFVKVSSTLFLFQIIFLIINERVQKKKHLDIISTNIFSVLCLIFIGAILYYIERKKISFAKIILIVLFILLFANYLIYDTNIILNEKRRNFKENDYVLAVMYLYIDIVQTIFELIKNFYNLNEPEARPTANHGTIKRMIYTGDEDYDQLYAKESEDDQIVKFDIKRTNSAKGLKLISNAIIEESQEENYVDIIEKDADNDRSFKRTYSGENLVFDGEDDNQ